MKNTIANKSLNINKPQIVSIPLDKNNSCENFFPFDCSLSFIESSVCDVSHMTMFIRSGACSSNIGLQQTVLDEILDRLESLQSSLSVIRFSQASNPSGDAIER
ncbi:hypothetical protein [Vibrio fluvialis]|uniref:hypothetical protein n=1 Tax=Vibrio fluvialis TaxID=676 RepID=UPI00301D74C9